ncbi:MAG: putative replicase [Circoviridae sp.]|nr:MAG: putative replicase [Circoviridae sp.]
MIKLCLFCVRELFDCRDHFYGITIKSPPDDNIHIRIVNLVDYLIKKDIVMWIVKCQSTSGYIHFHGILSFPESQSVDNKMIKAVQRKINRDMGFFTINPLYSGTALPAIDSYFNYIRASNNTNNGSFEQDDYIKIWPSKCCMPKK